MKIIALRWPYFRLCVHSWERITRAFTRKCQMALMQLLRELVKAHIRHLAANEFHYICRYTCRRRCRKNKRQCKVNSVERVMEKIYASFYAKRHLEARPWCLITVRLLTHVLCKPTHFFFPSFIATISYSLQTSFNSLMKDWADKYHVWGTPTRSTSRSNSR